MSSNATESEVRSSAYLEQRTDSLWPTCRSTTGRRLSATSSARSTSGVGPRNRVLTGWVVNGPARRQTRNHESKDCRQTALPAERGTSGHRPAQQDRGENRRTQDQDRDAPVHRGSDELQADETRQERR